MPTAALTAQSSICRQWPNPSHPQRCLVALSRYFRSQASHPLDLHHLLVDAPNVPTIVVDPRRTSLAEVASIHLRLRPGTDGALALGLAHVIFQEDLQNQGFLDSFAHGLEDYRRYIREYTPARTSAITGIPEQSIVQAARLYGRSRPAQIVISPCSTTHHSNGFQAHRAILLLAATCGNLDVEGGNRPWSNEFRETSIDLSGVDAKEAVSAMGANDFPLFIRHYREAQGMLLADEAGTTPIPRAVC